MIGDKRVLIPKLVNCCSFNSTVSCVCVGEPFNEDEPETPYSMGSCRRKWQDYGPLWLHGRAGWKLLTCAIPAVGSWVCIRDSMIVTEKKAYWVIPTAVKEVSYAPVRLNQLWWEQRESRQAYIPPNHLNHLVHSHHLLLQRLLNL